MGATLISNQKVKLRKYLVILKLPFKKPSSGNYVASDNFLLGRESRHIELLRPWKNIQDWCKNAYATKWPYQHLFVFLKINRYCVNYEIIDSLELFCFLPELLLMRCDSLRFGEMISTGSMELTSGLPGENCHLLKEGFYYRENWHIIL